MSNLAKNPYGLLATGCPAQAPARIRPSKLTDAQATLAHDNNLGASLTTPIETTLRDIDSSYTPDENQALPFLAAQLYVEDGSSQAYGRHTKLWLHYGASTGELTPAQAREALEAMRGFVGQLEAVVALAEHEATRDFDGDPEIARLDREAEDRRIAAITEHRPGGAQ